MDARQFRDLQEAYRGVYTGYEKNDDIRSRDKDASEKEASHQLGNVADRLRRGVNLGRISQDDAEKEVSKTRSDLKDKLRRREEKVNNRTSAFLRTRGNDALRMGKSPRNQNEQADLYYHILLHLLDEGYAETPEAAVAIMENMSEEWRDSIIG